MVKPDGDWGDGTPMTLFWVQTGTLQPSRISDFRNDHRNSMSFEL